MHTVLKPLITGIETVPWTARTLPATALLLGSGLLYFTFCKNPIDDLLWVQRVNPKTGK